MNLAFYIGDNMTILVTGATGTIGSQVVKQLADSGAQVRAAVHSMDRSQKIQNPGVELVEFDFDNHEKVSQAFEGVSKLFLLTPLVPNMVELTEKLVEHAKKAGVSHIVKISAMGAESDPGITLGRWHRAAEKIIESSGIPYTFLRPNSFMQNYIVFHGQSIKKEGKFYMPTGDGKAALIDVRDIASVAVKALTGEGHDNKSYDLTGGEALSNNECADIMSEVTGKKIEFVDVPEEKAIESMKQNGVPDWLIEAMSELHDIYKKGYMAGTSENVKTILGKDPISFKQFVQDYKEEF